MKKSPDILLTIVVLSVFASHQSECFADWPAFRGPTRDGIVRAENGQPRSLPTTWTATQNVLWRTEIPGQGWSSPVVVGERIFLTAAIPESPNAEDTDYSLVLLEVAAGSGEIVRRTDLFRQPSDAPQIHTKNSHASPTPVFDGQNLFVHFGHQGTACVSLEGEVLWKNDSLGYAPVHGNGGSPAVIDDLLIFSRDGADTAEVVALDKHTGELDWRLSRNVEADKKFSFCTPLVVTIQGRPQLIVPGSNVVQSIDPKTGQEIWRLRYDGYSVIPRPIYEAGLVFVCTGYNRPSLLAIDPTGSGDVTETHLKWRSDSNVPHTPSLIGWQGRILMVNDKGGIVSCLDASNGELLWKQRLGGNFSASPLLAGSLLYLLSEEGVSTILDVESGSEVSENSIGERCLASLAIVDHDLLLRTANGLYRISDR